jgi:type II restriction enzyme
MNLNLPVEIAQAYSSNAQQIRVMSEYWVSHSIFCPSCGSKLTSFDNNQPVADFYCAVCSEEYELKSKHGKMGKKVVDGAYSTMIERLKANNNPNFFFLSYDKDVFSIRDFLVIPKYFFIDNIIERRKPLSLTARRAGWIGCNIVVEGIPEFGKIFYVQNGIANHKDDVLEKWHKTTFIKSTHDIEAKGWLFDVLVCIDKLKKTDFSLDEIYQFEALLKAKHPQNNNIQAKIRQQLQYLRDKNVIEFVKPGQYRLKS